jgi:hypothetical protein
MPPVERVRIDSRGAPGRILEAMRDYTDWPAAAGLEIHTDPPSPQLDLPGVVNLAAELGLRLDNILRAEDGGLTLLFRRPAP